MSADVAPATPALAKEMSAFSPILGEWNCKGVFVSSGKEMASHISASPALDGAWIAVHHDDLPPNRFHALEMWGFDKQAGQFFEFIYDNFGAVRRFTSPGWSADKLIWTKDSQDRPERFIFKTKSALEMIVDWQVKKEKDWVTGDTLTCHKSQDHP